MSKLMNFTVRQQAIKVNGVQFGDPFFACKAGREQCFAEVKC